MKKLSSALLIVLLLLFPIPASAQEQLGSITIEKRLSELDSPGAHPVAFELSGGDLKEAIRLHSNTYTVHFADLSPGTYTIHEIATRTGDVSRGTIAPITVTIPQGTLFDVTLHPKTQPLRLLKSADINSTLPGGTFTYQLDGTVPLPDTRGKLHRYIIQDSLPEGVTLTGDSSMKLLLDNATTTTLEEEKHYTISNQGDAHIMATFTPTGLDLLARERTNITDLKVLFSFDVNASTALKPGTQLLNIAHLYPDGFPETGDESVISNEHALKVTSEPLPTLPVIPGFPDRPDSSPSTPETPSDSSADPILNEVISPQAPEKKEEKNNILASTGASVLGLIGVGALMVIAGIIAILRGRRA